VVARYQQEAREGDSVKYKNSSGWQNFAEKIDIAD
jgi:hypothetical protein